MIKLNFGITQDGFTFRDTLYLPDDHNLTEDEIESLKMERFTNWKAFIEAASSDPDNKAAE